MTGQVINIGSAVKTGRTIRIGGDGGQVITIGGKGAVVLVNRERVVYELLELSRMKIAQRLKIPMDKVNAECRISKEGKFRVQFGVDEDAIKGQDPEKAKEVVRAVYQSTGLAFKERFLGLGERWHDRKEEKTAPTAG